MSHLQKNGSGAEAHDELVLKSKHVFVFFGEHIPTRPAPALVDRINMNKTTRTAKNPDISLMDIESLLTAINVPTIKPKKQSMANEIKNKENNPPSKEYSLRIGNIFWKLKT